MTSINRKLFNRKLFAGIVTTVFLQTIVACGFHLRGTQYQVLQSPNISLQIAKDELDKSKENKRLRDKITRQLTTLGATVTIDAINSTNSTGSTNKPDSKNQTANNVTSIKIDNINLRKHRLVGRLTEIQLVLTADVSLSVQDQTPLNRQLQTQRSYQLDQETVSTNDIGEQRIITRMYDEMADKISQQLLLYQKTAHSSIQSK